MKKKRICKQIHWKVSGKVRNKIFDKVYWKVRGYDSIKVWNKVSREILSGLEKKIREKIY